MLVKGRPVNRDGAALPGVSAPRPPWAAGAGAHEGATAQTGDPALVPMQFPSHGQDVGRGGRTGLPGAPPASLGRPVPARMWAPWRRRSAFSEGALGRAALGVSRPASISHSPTVRPGTPPPCALVATRLRSSVLSSDHRVTGCFLMYVGSWAVHVHPGLKDAPRHAGLVPGYVMQSLCLSPCKRHPRVRGDELKQ